MRAASSSAIILTPAKPLIVFSEPRSEITLDPFASSARVKDSALSSGTPSSRSYVAMKERNPSLDCRKLGLTISTRLGASGLGWGAAPQLLSQGQYFGR